MPRLFDPIKIGKMELKNRLVYPATHMAFCPEGEVNRQLSSYYLERARGGVGLIVLGAFAVDRRGIFVKNQLQIWDDSFIPGLKRLIDGLHSYGAKVAGQLHHGGGEASPYHPGAVPMGPSAFRSHLYKQASGELTVEEIGEIVGLYGEAARRMQESGFDALEIHCVENALVEEFLSPHINRREDRYGGSAENRLRFLLEVIDRIKATVGNELALWCRFSGDPLVRKEGRLTIEDMKATAKRLEEAGVHALNVMQGSIDTGVEQIYMSVPKGAFVTLAQQVKEVVNIPVSTGTRLNDPAVAEAIVREGRADLVNLARPLIADAYFPQKAKEGRYDEIRKCIGCNQGCLDNTLVQWAEQACSYCLVNAHAGREWQVELSAAPKRKKVLILGGGPGGMECARVAAMRGHHVILCEASGVLGGQFRLAAKIRERREVGNLIKYLTEEMKRQRVDIRLGVTADVSTVDDERPDALVMATGAVPLVPEIFGVDKRHVCFVPDVLSNEAEIGRRVVVVGGGSSGCDVALHLGGMGTVSPEVAFFWAENGLVDMPTMISMARRGNKEVTIVARSSRIGEGIGRTSRWIVLKHLRQYNVKILTNTQVLEIRDEGVVIDDGERGQRMIPADTVVIARGWVSKNESEEKLRAKVAEFYSIGDCVRPRKALEAIREGFLVGATV